MTRKPQGLRWSQLPRCGGSDGHATTGSPAEGTFRCCYAVATHRVEWVWGSPKKVRGGYQWELRHDQDLSCERHLPALLERADEAVKFTRSPYREADWSPDEVPDPVVIRLEFVLDKRAKAHGNTRYIPVETPLAGSVEFKLF